MPSTLNHPARGMGNTTLRSAALAICQISYHPKRSFVSCGYMQMRQLISWATISALGLAVAGAAVYGSSMQLGPAGQLETAITAIDGSSSYLISFAGSSERSIVNPPSLQESIKEGQVTSILVAPIQVPDVVIGKRYPATVYLAIPAACGTSDQFAVRHTWAFVRFGYDSSSSDAVTRSGNRFTVSKRQSKFLSVVVQNGYVAQVRYFPNGVGLHAAPFTELVSEINDAPRITLPRSNNVIPYSSLSSSLRSCIDRGLSQ